MKIVESAILSTDLAMYFKKRNKFLELVDNGEFDWQSEEKKEREYTFCAASKMTAIKFNVRSYNFQIVDHQNYIHYTLTLTVIITTKHSSTLWYDDDRLRCERDSQAVGRPAPSSKDGSR